MRIKRKLSLKSILKAFEAISHFYRRVLWCSAAHVRAAYLASDTGYGVRLNFQTPKWCEVVVTPVAEKR